MMNFCNNFIIIIIVISFSKVCNVITLWKILLLSYYQCIYRNYLQIFATCMVVNFSQVSIFWMASSSQRRTRNVSSMPSSTLSLQRQRMPPRSSMFPSQIQSEPPSSQPSGESSTLQPTRPFPSHARRPRPEPSDSTSVPKKGRGSLKGLKVAKKANESSDGKLSIKFSTKLGGPIDINRRSFVDEVVLQMKQHIPIVGVKKWSQIPLEPKNVLKDKVLERWRLVDDDYARTKILRIAQERYRGWKSTLSATFKAYKDDHKKLLQNRPEELDPEEWEGMIKYFKTDDFQDISDRNAENRGQRESIHRTGSKSYSQISYENTDPETQEEPNDLQLLALAYCPNGQWIDTEKERVYDEAKKRIAEIEAEECRLLSAEEQDEIYQSIVGSKPNYVRGRGYMAKPPTFAERVRDEVSCEIQTLKKKLEEERAEREAERVVERAEREAERVKRKEERVADRAESDARLEALREEFMAIFANQSQGGNQYRGF